MHIPAVALPVLLDHSLFFIPGQEVVDEQHGDVEEKNQKPWPEQNQPQARDTQQEILRMVDRGIQETRDHALSTEFRTVDLKRANQKEHHTQKEDCTHEPAQHVEEEALGDDGVGLEKAAEAGRSP